MSDVLDDLMQTIASKKTEVVGVRVTKDTIARLDNLARKSGRARSAVAKALLESKLNEIEKQLEK